MRLTLALVLSLGLAGCALRGPPIPPGGPGSQAPAPGAPVQGSSQPPAAPVPGEAPPARPRMGLAATSLLGQAHAQTAAGEYAAAGATLERALRIEPENPLLWVELGRVQLQEGNATQADGMGRKALALAGGDVEAQGAAWALIAESLRALGRNGEATDADRRAAALTPH